MMTVILQKATIYKVVNPIIVIIFAYLAIQASNATLNGCDFLRLQFRALNDRNNYFLTFNGVEEPYIGLGLNYHQPLAGKDSTSWVNDQTCLPYTDLESEMFRLDTELNIVRSYYVLSHWITISITAIIALNTLISYFTPIQVHNFILFSSTPFMFISAAIQSHAYSILAYDSDGDTISICDRNRYFPDGWYEDYPLHGFPEYKYMKFFADCELGETAVYARQSILFQYVGCIAMLVVIAFMSAWESYVAKQEREAHGLDDDDLDDGSCLRWMLYRPVQRTEQADNNEVRTEKDLESSHDTEAEIVNN